LRRRTGFSSAKGIESSALKSSALISRIFFFSPSSFPFLLHCTRFSTRSATRIGPSTLSLRDIVDRDRNAGCCSSSFSPRLLALSSLICSRKPPSVKDITRRIPSRVYVKQSNSIISPLVCSLFSSPLSPLQAGSFHPSSTFATTRSRSNSACSSAFLLGASTRRLEPERRDWRETTQPVVSSIKAAEVEGARKREAAEEGML
jgi:hypothetical protein